MGWFTSIPVGDLRGRWTGRKREREGGTKRTCVHLQVPHNFLSLSKDALIVPRVPPALERVLVDQCCCRAIPPLSLLLLLVPTIWLLRLALAKADHSRRALAPVPFAGVTSFASSDVHGREMFHQRRGGVEHGGAPSPPTRVVVMLLPSFGLVVTAFVGVAANGCGGRRHGRRGRWRVDDRRRRLGLGGHCSSTSLRECGGSFGDGERVAAPFFRHAGRPRIDRQIVQGGWTRRGGRRGRGRGRGHFRTRGRRRPSPYDDPSPFPRPATAQLWIARVGLSPRRRSLLRLLLLLVSLLLGSFDSSSGCVSPSGAIRMVMMSRDAARERGMMRM